MFGFYLNSKIVFKTIKFADGVYNNSGVWHVIFFFFFPSMYVKLCQLFISLGVAGGGVKGYFICTGNKNLKKILKKKNSFPKLYGNPCLGIHLKTDKL